MVNARKNSFTAAQVADNGMAMGAAFMRIIELEKEVARLRHHVSVLTKRGNRREERIRALIEAEVGRQERGKEDVAEVEAVGASPITSGAYKVVAEEESVAGDRIVVEGSEAEEIGAGVEAMSVGSEEDEDEVVNGKIVVRLLGDRKRRIVEEEETRKVEERLVAPLGPRAICSGLMRVVGKESVCAEAGPRLVAGGGSSTSAAVGLSWRPDARRQSPEEGGGYQLRPRVGEYGYRGTEKERIRREKMGRLSSTVVAFVRGVGEAEVLMKKGLWLGGRWHSVKRYEAVQPIRMTKGWTWVEEKLNEVMKSEGDALRKVNTSVLGGGISKM